MNVKITSRKFRAKDSLKEFITKKVNSLEKFHDEILDADVILSYTHQKDSIKNAEIIIKVPGKILTASEETEDFNKSVDIAVKNLERQLKKLKTKKIDKKR